MASRAPLRPSLRGWSCQQCRRKQFSTSNQRQAFGPEHPRYIEVPEAPQQALPYRPFIKGRLPVPRNILSGDKGLEKADDEAIAKSTQRPSRKSTAERGSREEWKQKISENRRQNLRDGLKALRTRAVGQQSRRIERETREAAEKAALRAAPEREDERLTTPSHGLDLEKLLHGPLEDPTREARLAQKARNVELHAAAKRALRLDNLHTLYMNARSFIVTPAQLDKAIEEEFNKDFRQTDGLYAAEESNSMWAHGPPMTVRDMLNPTRVTGRSGFSGAETNAEVNGKRITRIAEKLTGGKMEDGQVGR